MCATCFDIALQFEFSTKRYDPLDELKPGLETLFENCLIAEPENYDYTIRSMGGDDLEITRSIIKEIERMIEDVQNKHLSKAGVAQAIDMLCQRLLRLEGELIPLAKKQSWK